MKISAEQFARLTELLQKGDNLTAEEQTEKASLEALIVAAEEQTTEEGEKESEEEETAAPETPAADPVDDKASFEKLSMGAKFKALIASRAGLSAKLSAAAAKIKTLGAELAAMTDRATQAETALAEAKEKLTTSQARVTQLEAEAKDLHTAVTDELSGIGIDAKDAPGVVPTGGKMAAASEEELNEQLAECKTHGERVALIKAFKANKAAAAKQSAA